MFRVRIQVHLFFGLEVGLRIVFNQIITKITDLKKNNPKRVNPKLANLYHLRKAEIESCIFEISSKVLKAQD